MYKCIFILKKKFVNPSFEIKKGLVLEKIKTFLKMFEILSNNFKNARAIARFFTQKNDTKKHLFFF